MVEDIVVLGGARTAIGTFGGSLAGTTPIDMATHVASAAMQRTGTDPETVGHVAFGHVINTEPRDMYLSRVASLKAGIPETVPAMNVNRLCGSGAQAIVSVVQSLKLGDAEIGLAGGADCMSRSPYYLADGRWGRKMGHSSVVDAMLGALSCPFGTGHMGVTAENVAAENGIDRARQDSFALESQRRTAAAIEDGRFEDQIAPITIRERRTEREFSTDEHPRVTSMDDLARLKPAFTADGTVTPGNSSGINDGAAAVVLATASSARRNGLTPRARITGYAHAGVRPDIMGIGPVPAVRKLVGKLGIAIGDFDLIEANEAFAAQALAVNRQLDLDPGKVNPNGGAIALGHPIGATGTILVLKALHELERTGKNTALITMCIGGGQGIALSMERMN